MRIPSSRPPSAVLLWDALGFLLVFFPFLTGGIWIQRPGLFFEISDIGASTLIVALVGAVLKFGFKQPIESGYFVRALQGAWRKWLRALGHSPSMALFSGAFVIAAIWAWAALVRHATLDSHAFDLGIFTNTIWNFTHGYGFYSSVKGGMNLFADHQSPIFMLLAPVFAIFPHPATLLIAQALGLALGAVPLYFIGRQFLQGADHQAAAALPLLYWAYLPIRNASQFDFHPEVFMLPLFLGAVAGLQSLRLKHRLWGSLSLVLALAAKESAGPLAMGIGLAWALGAGPAQAKAFLRKLGYFLLVLGLGTFLFDIKAVPKLLGNSYAYDELYSQYGGGLSGILLAPLTKPLLVLHHLFGSARIKFLFWTLAPLGFLPLLNPRALVAALPAYLMLFLSAGDHRVDIHWHYGIEPAIGLFFALPAVLAVYVTRRGVAVWILFCALGTFSRSEFYRIREPHLDSHGQWLTSEFLPCVDENIALAASDAFVPHLSARHWITKPDALWQSPNEAARCVIYDSSVSNWPMDSGDEKKLFVMMQPWRLSYECGSLKVWELVEGCMKCVPHCPIRKGDE